MSEQSRRKIAVLERALLIAARMFADAGYDANGSTDPEKTAPKTFALCPLRAGTMWRAYEKNT